MQATPTMPFLSNPASNYPVLQSQYPPQHTSRSLQGASFSTGGRTYKLEVVQQPIRARMCGFGDKDRRPITPPPCIRLTVFDETGKEIDPSEIDAQHFVLTVDLWNQDGTQEVNLVRHSNTSPAISISAATTTAYPPPPERPFLSLFPSPASLVAYYRNIGDHATANHWAAQSGLPQPGLPSQVYHTPGMYQQTSPTALTNGMGPGSQPYVQAAMTPISIVPTPTAGMFTRNLIGSLAVNAFKLTDADGKLGLWFVLQDLSVRTEGPFRLKCNFVDVGAHDGSQGQLNTGKAPVLATTYSETFQVYSAKKFPGVIESTPLSKAFAAQGIKIPIRKDGPKSVINAEEYARDEE